MKTVVVNQNGKTFSAVSGKNKSYGNTIGEAIDALTKKISTEMNPVIYIQDFQPDEFFTAKQQQRLSELMEKLKNNNSNFSDEERSELEKLIDEELDGSAKRVAKIAEKLGK
jgi:hypothetical protein